GLQLQIEAHAPGVYRLRCASAGALNPEKRSARARAHAEMLLARQESVGELAVSSIAEPPGRRCRIQQGDTTLEITQSPLQLAVYRGEDCILTTPEGAVAYDDQGLWRLSFDLAGDDALHGAGATSGELDRRGTMAVSDNTQAPALPLVWSPKG